MCMVAVYGAPTKRQTLYRALSVHCLTNPCHSLVTYTLLSSVRKGTGLEGGCGVSEALSFPGQEGRVGIPEFGPHRECGWWNRKPQRRQCRTGRKGLWVSDPSGPVERWDVASPGWGQALAQALTSAAHTRPPGQLGWHGTARGPGVPAATCGRRPPSGAQTTKGQLFGKCAMERRVA